MINSLKKCNIFKNISDFNIQEILKISNYKVKKYAKNEYIKFRGDIHDSMHIILLGAIKAEMINENGNSHIIERIQENSILAPAFLFNDKNIFPVNLVAEVNTEVLIIPKDNVIKMLQYNNVFLTNYLNIISNKAFFLSQKIWFNFSNKTIKEKLSSYILSNSKNNKFILNTTIENFAELFDVARPSLSRTLKELIDIGAISRVNQKEFIILDRDLLE